MALQRHPADQHQRRLVGLLVLFAAVTVLVRGTYPQGIFDAVMGMNRWAIRVAAYAALMTDAYPAFRRDQGGRDPLTLARPDWPLASATPTSHAPGAGAGMTNPAVQTVDATSADHELATRRLNLMRCGYAFIGVGLAIVKWPILVQNVSARPVSEGVVACLLTAMSLLAFLGLRYPVRMLPILLFEVTWKVIWIAAVALPHLVAGDIDPASPGSARRDSWVAPVTTRWTLLVDRAAILPWADIHPSELPRPAVRTTRGVPARVS